MCVNLNIFLDAVGYFKPVFTGRTCRTVAFVVFLLLQLYTVDHFVRTLVTVGYATLNVFVESGTEKQPIADTGVQVH